MVGFHDWGVVVVQRSNSDTMAESTVAYYVGNKKGMFALPFGFILQCIIMVE